MVSVQRFAAVDGLRGLACLAVVAHHAYYHAGRYQWPWGLPQVFSYGYLGVEIFFVLSGFCLAYPLLGESNVAISWSTYAKRRARRILPAYWAALALLLIGSLVLAHWHVGVLSENRLLLVPSGRQFFYAFFLIGVWFNPVFWTLTLEARWYFLLPFAIQLARRAGVAALWIASVALSALYAFLEPLQPGRLEFIIGPLPLFLPLFASGMCAAALLRRQPAVFSPRLVAANRSGIVISLLLVAVFTPSHPENGFPFSRIIPGGLLATTLLIAALWDPLARRVLSSRFLAITGLVSYSLYLVHLPMIQFAYSITSRWALADWQQLLLYQGIVVPICIGAAALFYVCFERPFLMLVPSRRTAVAVIDASGEPVTIPAALPIADERRW